MSRASGYQADK